jgi:hypothetical protein
MTSGTGHQWDYTTKAILSGRTDYENLTPKSLTEIVTKDLAL